MKLTIILICSVVGFGAAGMAQMPDEIPQNIRERNQAKLDRIQECLEVNLMGLDYNQLGKIQEQIKNHIIIATTRDTRRAINTRQREEEYLTLEELYKIAKLEKISSIQIKEASLHDIEPNNVAHSAAVVFYAHKMGFMEHEILSNPSPYLDHILTMQGFIMEEEIEYLELYHIDPSNNPDIEDHYKTQIIELAGRIKAAAQVEIQRIKALVEQRARAVAPRGVAAAG